MKIEREVLQTALAGVRPGLGGKGKSSLPQSADFVFRDGRVFTFNDEVSASAPIDGLDFEGATPGEAFLKLLERSDQKEVEVTSTDTEIRLKSGRIKAGVALDGEIVLPLDAVGVPKKWTRAPSAFREALKFAMFACGKDLSIPALTCVHLRPDGRIEATDNFRITTYDLDELKIPAPVLIPASSVATVVSYAFESFATDSKGWFHFKTKDDVRISVRTHAGTFPEIDSKLFKMKGATLPLPKTLDESLDRILIFSDRDYFLDERALVTLEKRRMRLRAESPKGWVEEDLNLKYDGDPARFYVHPQFLQDMARLSKSCILGSDRMMFKGDDWTHLVALSEHEG